MKNSMVSKGIHRICALIAAFLCGFSTHASENDKIWSAIKKPGAIVLFRHAIAPGGGDPVGYVMNQCHTQRNLDEAGRAQARRIGERFREQRVKVEAVWNSQWCRTRETAQLAFPGLPKDAPAFNSFFSDRTNEPAQTAAARKQLLDWRGRGTLVVVTHQVNITALTGISLDSGEGIVVERVGAQLRVVGRLSP